MRNISTFEPFVESIAQLIIKLCIWTFFHQDHLEKFQGEANPLFTESWQHHFFIFTIIVSGLASVLGIIRFFKDGPVRFLPQTGAVNGIFTFKFILTFFATLFNALAKILLLIIMLYYSLGVLEVFSNPPEGQHLVGTVTDPKCSHISLIQACLRDDTFQVRTHFPDEKYKTLNWSSLEPGNWKEWRVFVRDENIRTRLFWNENKEKWIEAWVESCLTNWNCELCKVGLSNNCGAAESITIHCSEHISIVTLSRLTAFSLWFALNILPQLLLVILVFCSLDVKGTLQTFLHFPQLMLSPTITNMIFGPKDVLWKCRGKPVNKTILLSPQLCWINNSLSLFGNLLSIIILYHQFCQADPLYRCQSTLDFWSFLQTRGKNENTFIALPPGLIILFHCWSFLMAAIVIHVDSFQTSTTTSSFFGPLECQELGIHSIVHELEDPQAPYDGKAKNSFMLRMKNSLKIR